MVEISNSKKGTIVQRTIQTRLTERYPCERPNRRLKKAVNEKQKIQQGSWKLKILLGAGELTNELRRESKRARQKNKEKRVHRQLTHSQQEQGDKSQKGKS